MKTKVFKKNFNWAQINRLGGFSLKKKKKRQTEP